MLSNFIAKRIYNDSDSTKRVSLPAVRIATLGIAIGLAVMITSVAVVMGFKHTIRDKVVGFGSHIIVSNFKAVQQTDLEPVCTSDSMTLALQKAPQVEHVQRYAISQGLLKTDNDFLGVMLKGVAEEWDSTFIHSNIVAGTIPTFSSKQSSGKILISQIMSNKLGLKVGDKVFAYFLTNNNVRTRRFTVSGIYETNLTKFDESQIFCDLYTVQKLNAWCDDQASGYEITVKDFDMIDETAKWFIHKVNRTTDHYDCTYSSATIQETNPQIFSWLGLLDMNVWIILALMICVSSVTMTSGLLIIILERVPMIGTLKALGARNGLIRHTFLWFGSFILFKGIIIGNIIGIGICLIQKYTGLVTLDPQTYYVSEAPIELDILWLLLLNAGTILISIIILTLPSFLVSHIKPTKAMKFRE